jgi:lauroyl/myristoyl acyltransferase
MEKTSSKTSTWFALRKRHLPNRDVNWQKELRYWFEWFGVALCVRIIPLLPLALLRLLADIAGWLAFHLDRKSRAVALANLEAVFGEEKNLLELRAIARRSVQLFGRSVLELVLDSETELKKSRPLSLFRGRGCCEGAVFEQ